MFHRIRDRIKNSGQPLESLKVNQEEIAKLRIEKELIERDNVEAAKALEEKRKSLGLDFKGFKKLEEEHRIEIDKLVAKKLDLEDVVNELDNREKVLRFQINGLIDQNESLSTMIMQKEARKTEIDQAFKVDMDKYASLREINQNALNKQREELLNLGTRISIAEGALERIKTEFDEMHQKAMEETKILGIRQKDLEIYERRLRKKYPKDTITIK